MGPSHSWTFWVFRSRQVRSRLVIAARSASPEVVTSYGLLCQIRVAPLEHLAEVFVHGRDITRIVRIVCEMRRHERPMERIQRLPVLMQLHVGIALADVA